ncbi:MAG: putative collagen-binding domain-containing protein, partial [Tunicatimonas sp.]
KHLGYLSSFLHKLGDDFLKLRPDQSLVVDGNSSSYDSHIQATVANDRSFALVYSASDAAYAIDVSKLSSPSQSATWYNPRANQYQTQHSLPPIRGNIQQFDPPGHKGAGNDWVLVLGNP